MVTVLKELGVKARFTHLVEGEGLINNGFAMLMYIMYLNLEKQSSSNTMIILDFIKSGIGGPILGIIAGFISKN